MSHRDVGTGGEWPKFDHGWREDVAKPILAMLKARKLDLACAAAIVDELERAVFWYGSQSSMPGVKEWPFPAEIGRAAHALVEALRRAGLLPLHRCADPGLMRLTFTDPEAFVENLERLASPPRPPRRGAVKRDESRNALEEAVVLALKNSGLTWQSGPLPATVLSKVVEHAFGSAPATPEAARAALKRAAARLRCH